MPRSNRVWRESVLCGIATDVAPRAGFSSGTVSLIAHNGSSAILTGSIDWHYMTRLSFISGRFLDLKQTNNRTFKTTEKHLSQEGLHETVGFEKAHFSCEKCRKRSFWTKTELLDPNPPIWSRPRRPTRPLARSRPGPRRAPPGLLGTQNGPQNRPYFDPILTLFSHMAKKVPL